MCTYVYISVYACVRVWHVGGVCMCNLGALYFTILCVRRVGFRQCGTITRKWIAFFDPIGKRCKIKANN